jgi:hypothetical protein
MGTRSNHPKNKGPIKCASVLLALGPAARYCAGCSTDRVDDDEVSTRSCVATRTSKLQYGKARKLA